MTRIERRLRLRWGYTGECVWVRVFVTPCYMQTNNPTLLSPSLPRFLSGVGRRAGPAHDEVKQRFTSLSTGADSCLSKESETERRRDERWKDGRDGGLQRARSRYYGDCTAAWRRRRLLWLSDTDAHIKVSSTESEREAGGWTGDNKGGREW